MAYTEYQKQQHIRELQDYLHSISHLDSQTLPHIIPDGVYGEKTAAAIRQFQEENGLHPTGETDTATWNAIVQMYRKEIAPPVHSLKLFPTGVTAYSAGDNGSAIFIIQGVLQALHAIFPEIPLVASSGIYDSATENAVQQFQSYTALPSNGIVNIPTWNYLIAAILLP